MNLFFKHSSTVCDGLSHLQIHCNFLAVPAICNDEVFCGLGRQQVYDGFAFKIYYFFNVLTA
jgi:hypothetical protein